MHIPVLMALVLVFIVSGCSTTSKLEDGEILYNGMYSRSHLVFYIHRFHALFGNLELAQAMQLISPLLRLDTWLATNCVTMAARESTALLRTMNNKTW